MLSHAALPVSVDDALCLRLTGFVSFLRANAYSVGLEDAVLLVQAASRFGVLDEDLLRWTTRALLCRRAEDLQRFNELFDSWFLPPNRRQMVESRGSVAGALERRNALGGSPSPEEGMPVATAANDDEMSAAAPEGGTARRGASDAESLAEADFRHLRQPEEMRALDAVMRQFALRLRRLQLRRERSGGGARIDIPGTVRRSVSHGGEPIELAFRRRRRTVPRLVLLLDVSRSMSLYSFFFLRVARALQGALFDTRVFIWHTRLSGVSAALSDPDPWRAQERLQMLSAGWAGGTRIGECLQQFEREHASAVHARTAVVVVSDGYDTGPPEVLAQALRRIRRHARRLIWLNPLAAQRDYQPLAKGMQAALPHIDLLAPAHNLVTVERALAALLNVVR